MKILSFRSILILLTYKNKTVFSERGRKARIFFSKKDICRKRELRNMLASSSLAIFGAATGMG